jgi:hypothetical protein
MKNSTDIKGFLPRNFKRKYRIKELIHQYPIEERKKKIKALAAVMEIEESSVRRIWNYRPEDSSEAKPSQLMAAARFFNIQLEEIFSDHIGVVTSVTA